MDTRGCKTREERALATTHCHLPCQLGNAENCGRPQGNQKASPLMLSAMMPSFLRMVCPPSCTGVEGCPPRGAPDRESAHRGACSTGQRLRLSPSLEARLRCPHGAQQHKLMDASTQAQGRSNKTFKASTEASPPAHPQAPRGAAPAPKPSAGGRSAGRGRRALLGSMPVGCASGSPSLYARSLYCTSARQLSELPASEHPTRQPSNTASQPSHHMPKQTSRAHLQGQAGGAGLRILLEHFQLHWQEGRDRRKVVKQARGSNGVVG